MHRLRALAKVVHCFKACAQASVMVEGGVHLRLKRGSVCALLKSLVGWWKSLQEVEELAGGGRACRRWESLAGEHKFLTLQNTMYSFPSAPSDAEQPLQTVHSPASFSDAEQPLQTVHSPASFSDAELSLLKQQGVTKITPECVCVY